MIRLLIDECLSVDLAADARARGHDATHVAWLGKLGAQDWTLFRFLQEEAVVLVTNNRRDFLDLHGRAPLHAGLVIIVPRVRRELQQRLLVPLLDELEKFEDTMNTLLEVFSDGEIRTRPWHAGAYDAAYVASPGRAP